METQAFERLGGTGTMQVDIRFIGATNRPLEEMIAAGSFREDFYFRLNVLPVALPPLREHKEDIPHLARHFAERIGRRSGKPIERIARGAIRRLVDSDWPGNVRQLQNAIERAVILCGEDGYIHPEHLGLTAPPHAGAGDALDAWRATRRGDGDGGGKECGVASRANSCRLSVTCRT